MTTMTSSRRFCPCTGSGRLLWNSGSNLILQSLQKNLVGSRETSKGVSKGGVNSIKHTKEEMVTARTCLTTVS